MSMLSKKPLPILAVVSISALLFSVWGYSSSIQAYLSRISDSWSIYSDSPSKKGALLNDLRGIVGYGGFIHDFKNYILRHDERYREWTLESFAQAEDVLAEYRVQDLSRVEQDALDSFEETLKVYREKLDVATRMIAENAGIEEIDAAVKVDDTAAVMGLNVLANVWIRTQSQGSDAVNAAIERALKDLKQFGLVIVVAAITLSIVGTLIYHLYRETRQLLRRVQLSESRYHSIVNNTTDCIVTTSGTGKIETFNRVAEAIFGYREVELLGEDVSILLDPNERLAHKSFIQNSKLYESRIVDQARGLLACHKDGTLFPIELSLGVFALDGERKFVGVIRDITVRRAAEQMLMTAKLEAENASAAKSRFVANVSHELRTPLNAIIGFADMIAMEPFGKVGHEKYHEYANDIMNSGHHLMAIISDILDVSKIEEGKFVLAKEDTSIADLVGGSLKTVEKAAKDKNIEIVRAIDVGSDSFFCDPTRVRQVFINILDNAVKFTPPGGRVDIDVRDKGVTHIRITISDTGPGVAVDKIASIMRPFERISSDTKREEEGAGLGLPIAKHLTELHNGTLTFSSEVGVGSTVTIILPRR